MNRVDTECNDDALRVLLRDEETSERFSAATRHVERCEHCQMRLEHLAAREAFWHESRSELHALADTHDGSMASGRASAMRMPENRYGMAWSESMAEQMLSPPSHPEMMGRIGRYDVERLIGSGGMGIVFKAFDTELNRPIAVKLLAPHLAGNGAARKRFAREARAAAAVVHEHVVAIHNVESDGPTPYLVMPYVAGESLQQRIDRLGPLTLCEVLRIARQTAAGLAAAHAQGLVHRDVKPSNILLEQGIERALLTDFGLARASDDASLTHTGYHLGTPQYMSPEQARGEPIDARSDLFSLGSVIYAMCTGHPPFRAETSFGILRRITDTEPRAIREITPEMPEWLEMIVERLLAKSPGDRFSSADALASLLEQCLAHVQQPTTVALPAELERPASRVRQLGSGWSLWNLRRERNAVGTQARTALILAGITMFILSAAVFVWQRPSDSNTTQKFSHATTDDRSFSWNVTEDDLRRFDRDLAEFERQSQPPWADELAEPQE